MRPSPLVTIVVTFVAAIYALLDVMSGSTGPLAIAAKWTGIVLVVLSFLRPKAGLVVLSIMCFYGDFYKKLAVVYGTASLNTVIEVLAVNMAVLGAIIAGTVNEMVTSRRTPHRAIIVVGLVSLFITGLLMLGNAPLSSRAQTAVNGGLYLALAGVIGYQYRGVGESLKLSRLHYLLGIPWVVVAVYQYFFGFADMDYVYARTFLSPVFSSQFYMENPRVFGLAGSASAYGAITFLVTYGMWRAFQKGARTFGWLAGTVVYFAGLVVSTQRTSLLQPFIVLVVWRFFIHRTSTRVFYMVVVGAALIVVPLSGTMLNNLGPIDSTLRQITGDEGWAAQVLRVSTFSDRLKGWSRLTRLESYSLFGKGRDASAEPAGFDEDDFAHDMINGILLSRGVVGLLACAAVLIFVTRSAHRMVLQTRNLEDRSALAFILACLAVNMLLTIFGGSNLHTVPINLIVATLAGHAVAILARPASPAAALPGVPSAPSSNEWQGRTRRFAPARPAWQRPHLG